MIDLLHRYAAIPHNRIAKDRFGILLKLFLGFRLYLFLFQIALFRLKAGQVSHGKILGLFHIVRRDPSGKLHFFPA